jgi:hypothetical protein
VQPTRVFEKARADVFLAGEKKDDADEDEEAKVAERGTKKEEGDCESPSLLEATETAR